MLGGYLQVLVIHTLVLSMHGMIVYFEKGQKRLYSSGIPRLTITTSTSNIDERLAHTEKTRGRMMLSQRQTDKTGMCLGSFSSKVFQCLFIILTLFGKKGTKIQKGVI